MKKKRLRRFLLLDLVLLLLLMAAVLFTHIANNDEATEAPDAADVTAEESTEDTSEPAEDGTVGVEKAERVYAYKGKSDDTLYTIDAYDSAVEAGAGSIVMPFVVSQDGTMYVADDDYAQELTGYGGFFSGMTDAQIDELETTPGSKVLKVSEVFDKYGSDVDYIIELKYYGERDLEALSNLLSKYDFKDKVTVSSEYFGGLRSLESVAPDITKIFLCKDEGEWNEAMGHEFVDGIAVIKEMMDGELCKAAHDSNKKFGAWTLDSETDIKSAIDMGADFYFTGEAALAAGLEKSE